MSWLIWNYKIPFALLSMRPIGDAFEFIDELNQLDWLCQWGWVGAILNRLIIPLGSALIYVFLIPKLTKRATEYTLEQQKGLRDTRKKIEDSALMSVEDGKALNRRYEDMVQEYETRIERYDARVNAMKREIDELTEASSGELGPFSPQVDDREQSGLVISLSDMEVSVLREIAQRGRASISEHDLRAIYPNKLEYDLAIDRLISYKYIRQSTNSFGSIFYSATPEGRQAYKTSIDT